MVKYKIFHFIKYKIEIKSYKEVPYPMFKSIFANNLDNHGLNYLSIHQINQKYLHYL
jgi:hypothetical protein